MASKTNTPALTIHHATAKKADKLGVKLWVEGDRYVAIDTQTNPDHEIAGPNAVTLLDLVLSKRPAALILEHETPAAAEPVASPVVEKVPVTSDADAYSPEVMDGHAVVGKTVVASKYKAKYDEHDGTNGDLFAECFSRVTRSKDGTLDLDALRDVANANGLDINKWAHLNPGQRRMCLGNVLRGKVRAGKSVVVGNQKIEPVTDSEGKPTGKSKVVVSRGSII